MGKNIEINGWMAAFAAGKMCSRPSALGAQGTLIGRSFLSAWVRLARAGVTRAPQIIQKELDITMAFCSPPTSTTWTALSLLPGTRCNRFVLIAPPVNKAPQMRVKWQGVASRLLQEAAFQMM